MVDFSAGLVFGLHGVIERVTNRVFLLSPATVHVESDTREPDISFSRYLSSEAVSSSYAVFWLYTAKACAFDVSAAF